MHLIDTHTHLYLKQFDEDREEVIQRSIDDSVKSFFLPNIDVNSIEPMLRLEEKWPGSCFAMMGLHPSSVKEDYKEVLEIIKSWLDRRAFVAVGEIGIDLYWDTTFVKEQKEAFLIQVEWAKEKELPIVVHARDSLDVLIELLEGVENRPGGVFHCFSGTAAQARSIIDLGFHLGVGGVLTFKNSGLDKIIAEIDLEHIVLETDSPYLAPTPYRGKRNESAYVRLIAEKLAGIKNKSIEEIALLTSKNAEKVFQKAKIKVSA